MDGPRMRCCHGRTGLCFFCSFLGRERGGELHVYRRGATPARTSSRISPTSLFMLHAQQPKPPQRLQPREAKSKALRPLREGARGSGAPCSSGGGSAGPFAACCWKES
uniref:Uncharacterized protein n=1 Tax=Chrysotila carterae TaxID=13221 RepID=A0A7S4C513_CHRCT